MKPLTIIQIVRAAQKTVNTYDKGEVISEVIRMGYGHVAADDVFRALETVRYNFFYLTNLKKYSKNQAGATAKTRTKLHDKEEYLSLKRLGKCVRCKKRDAEPGKAQCSYCLAKCREIDRRRDRSGRKGAAV